VREKPAWYSDGLCRNLPTKWWYEYDANKDKKAKAICRECPSQAACLQYALENDETGVWGGLNDTDRHRLVTKFYVQEALLASSQRKRLHEPLRPASESPAYLVRISFPQRRSQPVLSKAAALQAPTFPMFYRA
jgi:WhiB family redox-sensing transcriptional regulator